MTDEIKSETLEITLPNGVRIKTYEDKRGRFRWKALDDDGSVLATSASGFSDIDICRGRFVRLFEDSNRIVDLARQVDTLKHANNRIAEHRDKLAETKAQTVKDNNRLREELSSEKIKLADVKFSFRMILFLLAIVTSLMLVLVLS